MIKAIVNFLLYKVGILTVSPCHLTKLDYNPGFGWYCKTCLTKVAKDSW